MKMILLVTVSFIFLMSPLYASTLTMCPSGGVKKGDSKETVEKKCGKARSYTMTAFQIEDKSHKLSTRRIIFKDGTDILFIFIDNKVVISQNLN